MNKLYIATFYTHLGALLSCRRLLDTGYSAKMMPVPRVLSSSCGTCVQFEAAEAHRELLDRDIEALYESGESEKYRLLWKAES